LGLALPLPLDSFANLLYHEYIDYSNGVSKLTFTGKGAYMSTEQEKDLTGEEEFYQTIVIGGGQAGLAVGYFLARQGENFIILDKNPGTGDVWRRRWESLRLFTPSQFDSLPGMPFPKSKNHFPPKDEVADYLEEYARRFNLPVRHNVKVESLRRNGQNYQISAGAARFSARNVIVATGPFQAPHTPSFSKELDPGILQLHSSDYLNPKNIPVKSILVVGAGNSGAEIAIELAKAGKQVWLAGRDVGRVPANSPLGKLFDGRLVWWFMTHMLTVKTPIGRRMQANVLHHGTPLGRARREEIVMAGVILTPRMSGVQSGKPRLEDGRILPADGVIWATGFRPDYRWIKLPILDEQGYPLHSQGVVQSAPGLYFLGLPFQKGLSSSLLGGVGKDAAYIAAQVARKGH
jgi:putative flavoprotein involved in K+ transport